MKSVSVFGLGYVGAVTAACLADAGHSVIGVDVNPAKVASLEAGRTPVLEPGLEELIKSSREAGRLKATVDSDFAVLNSDISFVCVGTPSRRNGQLDTTILERSCKEIGRALRKKAGFHYVVVRSTVLPGTAESLVIPALEGGSGKRAGVDFAVCSHPEFTREGSAVRDFWEPAITVFGAQQAEHFQCL